MRKSTADLDDVVLNIYDIFKKMLKNLYFEQSNLAEITNTNEKFQKNWITSYPLIENIMDSD